MSLLIYQLIYKLCNANIQFQVYIEIITLNIIKQKISKLILNVALRLFSKAINFSQIDIFNIIAINKKY